MAHRVADELIARLEEAGVERIYGVVGDSLNPVTDGIRRSGGKLKFIQMRNEEAGAFAAGADAQLTGKLAVCAGSCGPGNLHLTTASSTATARARPSSRSPRTSPPVRSARASSRRRIPR